MQLLLERSRQVQRGDELLDVDEVLRSIGSAGHPGRELELDEANEADKPHATMLERICLRRVGEADGLRRTASRVVTRQHELDLHARRGVANVLAASELTLVAPTDQLRMKPLQLRLCDEYVDVVCHPSVAVDGERHAIDYHVRDAQLVQPPPKLLQRLMKLARTIKVLCRLTYRPLRVGLQTLLVGLLCRIWALRRRTDQAGGLGHRAVGPGVEALATPDRSTRSS